MTTNRFNKWLHKWVIGGFKDCMSQFCFLVWKFLRTGAWLLSEAVSRIRKEA